MERGFLEFSFEFQSCCHLQMPFMRFADAGHLTFTTIAHFQCYLHHRQKTGAVYVYVYVYVQGQNERTLIWQVFNSTVQLF
jgi:hypothetical protein